MSSKIKTIGLAALMFVVAVIVGCKKETGMPETVSAVEITDNASQTLFADQLEASISFKADGPWTVTILENNPSSVKSANATVICTEVLGVPDWVYVSVYDGIAGVHSLALTMVPNYGQCDRTAKIEVASGKDKVVFNITQLGIAMDGKPLDKKYDVYMPSARDEVSGKVGYWKNGEKVLLPHSENDNSVLISGSTAITGLKVYGNDVYVAGSVREADGNFRAVYWKNGEIVRLPKTLKETYATDILIVPSSDFYGTPVVYVAGYEKNAGRFSPQYWKDGAVYQLSYPDLYPHEYWNNYFMVSVQINHAKPAAIAVHGADVHVIGNSSLPGAQIRIPGPRDCAWYWKNGVRTNLIREADWGVHAYDLAIAPNGDVYIAGYRYGGIQGGFIPYTWSLENVEAILWKNGVPQKIEDNAMAKSVFIDGGDVYVAVTKMGNSTVYYYKNGQKVSMGNSTVVTAGQTHSFGRNGLTVVDGNVYLRNYNSTTGELAFWKNREKYTITQTSKDVISGDDLHENGDLIVVPHSPTRKW